MGGLTLILMGHLLKIFARQGVEASLEIVVVIGLKGIQDQLSIPLAL